MKILLTMNLPYIRAYGGANRSNRSQAEALAARHHSLRVVVPALAAGSPLTHHQMLEELEAEGIQVSSNGEIDVFTLHGVEVHAVVKPSRLRAYLVEQLRDFKPDWMLVSSEDQSQSLLEAALKTDPSRVVYLAHTPQMLPFGPASLYPGERRTELIGRAAAILTISRFVADYIQTWTGFVSFIHHPPHYGTGPFPHFGRSDKGYVLLMNACAVKGLSIFLALAQALPDVQFAALPGWGTTNAERTALGALPNVTLLKNRQHLDDILCHTRVLLMPSLWLEGFGMAVVDAMLRGIPVLASNYGGLVEAKLGTDYLLPVHPIKHFADRLDENLLPVPTVPQQDIGPWNTALSGLLADRALYERQSAAARDAALKFVSGLSVEPLEELLLRLATEPKNSRQFLGGRKDHNAPATRSDTGRMSDSIAHLTPEQQAPLMVRLRHNAFLRAEQGLSSVPSLTRVSRAQELPLLTEAEREQLLVEWNQTQATYPQDVCLHQLFEVQAEQMPAAVAVVFEDQKVTYRELNAQANQLAHYLQKHGVGPETLVGICVERSVEMIIGVLGILKAGGAYVPLDPMYPKERLAFMLEDTQAPMVLTQEHLLPLLPEHGAQVVCLDKGWEVIARESEENPTSEGMADTLAYVIYTSGSTGKPKGVLIAHSHVIRLFQATDAWFHFDPHDVWTLFHSYAFDFSVWEMWGALLYGGRLLIVPYWVSRSPEKFYELVCQEQVTVLNQTPSAFRQLIRAEQSATNPHELALRLVIFGGEALDFHSLKPWFDHHGDQQPQLVNMYGITETTVHVTYRPITAADLSAGKGSLIGVPLPDLELYVLDQHQNLVPIGVPGELYVGGAGVGRGYLNRPALTAERFIANPFRRQAGERLYRSGDLVRYLPNRDIEYLGRIDAQVKIRGFRIELGEIESVLSHHSAIRETVVMAREDVPGEQRLVAYVVPNQEQVVTASALRSFLQAKLPDYMVPAVYVPLAALPLTPNGKVDHRALPAPEKGRAEVETAIVAPGTPVEVKLAEIWAEVLGLEPVGVHDNFFELGGHSLSATQVISRVRNAFQVEVSLRGLFERPTIAEFAALIIQHQAEERQPEELAYLLAKLDALPEEAAQQLLADKTTRKPLS